MSDGWFSNRGQIIQICIGIVAVLIGAPVAWRQASTELTVIGVVAVAAGLLWISLKAGALIGGKRMRIQAVPVSKEVLEEAREMARSVGADKVRTEFGPPLAAPTTGTLSIEADRTLSFKGNVSVVTAGRPIGGVLAISDDSVLEVRSIREFDDMGEKGHVAEIRLIRGLALPGPKAVASGNGSFFLRETTGRATRSWQPCLYWAYQDEDGVTWWTARVDRIIPAAGAVVLTMMFVRAH